jgi:hypothetical protein
VCVCVRRRERVAHALHGRKTAAGRLIAHQAVDGSAMGSPFANYRAVREVDNVYRRILAAAYGDGFAAMHVRASTRGGLHMELRAFGTRAHLSPYMTEFRISSDVFSGGSSLRFPAGRSLRYLLLPAASSNTPFCPTGEL